MADLILKSDTSYHESCLSAIWSQFCHVRGARVSPVSNTARRGGETAYELFSILALLITSVPICLKHERETYLMSQSHSLSSSQLAGAIAGTSSMSHFSDLSSQETFLVTSYSPRSGPLGTLLTIEFSYEKSLPKDLKSQLEPKVFVSNIEIPHKAFEGSTGQVTLKCLLSNSLSDFRGPIPLRLTVFSHDGQLYDECNFGQFDLVNPQVPPMPPGEPHP